MEGCGEWVTDLQKHCVQANITEVFRDLGHTGEDIGRVRASALQTIAGELGELKENSEGIAHPLTLHTSLIAATSTGFTLWPSRHPMVLSSPAVRGGPIWLCGRATEYHRVPRRP
jgi:hypothetical protein